MWTPIINQGEETSLVEQKLEQIYTDIVRFPTDDIQNGLLTGYGSILLFLSQYYQHTQDPKHLDVFNQKFESFYNRFYKNPFYSFASGVAGINWLLRYLCKNDILEVDDIDDTLQELDDFVCQFLIYHAENNLFDFLHSGTGEAYYLCTTDGNRFDEHLQLFIKHLNDAKICASSDNAFWPIDTYVNLTSIGQVYNMSLSHGMASYMPLCIKYLQNHDDNLAKELLTKIVNTFKYNTLSNDHTSVFPKWIDPQTNEKLESPLSWCYGDPGMGQALYQAGTFLNDSEAQDIAIKALLKASKRRDLVKEHIVEACFCHGSSSLLHIYNRMYQKTQIDEFKDAALFWLHDTLTKGDHQTPYAGYSFFDNGDPSSNIGLLSGMSGVGLALLATIDATEPTWDECVLLS